MNESNRGAIFPIVAIFVVLGLGIVGFFVAKPYLSSSSNPTLIPVPTKPISQPNPTQTDLPPLWPGVEWGEPIKDTLLFPDSELGNKELNGFYIESKPFDNSSLSDEFFNYYESELNKRSWSFDELAGGGPYGEVRTYKNNNEYFVTRSRAIPETTTEFQLIIMYSE